MNQRLREWGWLVTHAYCGWRCCPGCKQVRYCAGRSYERQRCKDCFVGGSPKQATRLAA